ncbi:MAG: NifU family protein [Halobacteriaceae archaeon]
MSTEAEGGDELKDRIRNFLRRNFPQIQMHGGSATIQNIDRESGEVTIKLSGACSGCGISPMTIQAIKSRMTKEIPEISRVHADTGMSSGESSVPDSNPYEDDDAEDNTPEAPF